MQVVVGVIVAVVGVAGWVAAARHFRDQGWPPFKRHAAGLGAALGLFLMVQFMQRSPPARAEPVQQAVSKPAPASEPAPPAPAAPPPPVDVAALAVETHDFLDGAIQDLNLGIQANDWQGIHDEVEMPTIRMMHRWQEVPMPERMPYFACFDALDSLRLLTDGVTASSDSLRRRRTMLKDAESFDRNLASCRTAASKQRNS